MEQTIRRMAAGWSTFEKVWLLVFTAATVFTFLEMGGTLIGLVASLTGMITVVLVAKGKISNYYFGIVNIVLYAFIAYESMFFGEVLLNVLYYLPMQFIGLYTWSSNMDEETVSVTKLSNREKLMWGAGLTVCILAFGIFLTILNGSLPFLDATSTIFSVVAMYFMVRRVAEQWLSWFVVNVVSIYMWTSIFLVDGTGISMVVMWTAYLVNSVYGWWNWKKMEVEE